MYHRIDGKLVAVGIIDICTTVLNSAYFIYDPDYRHYNLGVVGAVIEIEYMRMVKERASVLPPTLCDIATSMAYDWTCLIKS